SCGSKTFGPFDMREKTARLQRCVEVPRKTNDKSNLRLIEMRQKIRRQRISQCFTPSLRVRGTDRKFGSLISVKKLDQVIGFRLVLSKIWFRFLVPEIKNFPFPLR